MGEIVTTTATATRASSAPREADTPKSLAAPERERRTGITVSPSPSLPKRSSRRMFCTETTYTAKTSLCQGDCDHNSDCKGNLVCSQRSGYSKIPGCSGKGKKDWDYCVPKPKPTKMVIKKSSQCAAMCKAKGHCCNDYKVGSNQMVSCAQACEMRISGVSKQNCQNKVNEFASKKGQGGCRLSFGKKTVGLCNRCKDLDRTCPHGVQNGKAGLDGCAALVQ